MSRSPAAGPGGQLAPAAAGVLAVYTRLATRVGENMGGPRRAMLPSYGDRILKAEGEQRRLLRALADGASPSLLRSVEVWAVVRLHLHPLGMETLEGAFTPR